MENKKNIFKALADFQQECPVLLKETDGYGYKYIKLDYIIAQINPLLNKHKLGFTQLIEDNGITTLLFHHPSGESIQSHAVIPECSMKGMNVYQSVGSGITYYRRYMLSSMLGIISDADTDAKVYTDTPKKTPKQQIFDNKNVQRLVKDFDLDVENAVVTSGLTPLEVGDENWEVVINYMNTHPDAVGKSLSLIVKNLQKKYIISKSVKKSLSQNIKS